MIVSQQISQKGIGRCTRNISTSTMPLKLAANLTMMFKEIPSLADRYKAAKDFGFKYVECAYPYVEPIDKLKEAKDKSGLEQVLINAWAGDLKAGDLGLAALPSRQLEFEEKLELTVQYAKALNCKRIHVQAGMKPKYEDTAMKVTYMNNLEMVAKRFEKEGITGLIEPLNNRLTAPRYFMTDIHEAVEIVKKINSPNLKVQFDFFHIQIMDGNLTGNLKKYLPYIGHIQIAQVPDRGEPNTDGEINYKYAFALLEELKYDGFIGLEYNPKGDTVQGLQWIKEFGLSL